MPTFKEFMEDALYHPEKGFYSRRIPQADFYTAPELHPAFAEILADEIVLALDALRADRPSAPLFIVEMGSGNGSLARQILLHIKDSHPRWHRSFRYVLVERSAELMLQSVVDLHASCPGAKVLGYTSLEDMLPVCGVMISNELVDAFPFHLLSKRGGEIRELFVRTDPKNGAVRESFGPLSEPALAAEAKMLSRTMVEGERHAVNLEARSWIKTAAERLIAGRMITIDYGKRFAPGAVNAPRGYRSHSLAESLLDSPGRTDLTAGVDFSDLIASGREAGLRERSYQTLGRFLLDRGILDRLPSGDDRDSYSQRTKMKTLFHPEGMGESFKVLIQDKGMRGDS